MTQPDESVLKDYHRWLYTVAIDWARDEHTVDDLAQEGYIAMWKALKTYDASKGALASWLTTAAKMRMRDVLRRGVQTGKPTRAGKRRQTDPVPADPSWSWMQEIVSSQVIEDAMLAYHNGEIMDALNSLSPAEREYVYRRFWSGAVSTSKERTAWVRDIRPVLQEKLAHLAEV